MLLAEFDAEKYERTIRNEGREEGIEQGKQQGLRDAARAFVETSVSRGVASDYILEMVQQCFRFSREDADALYRECKMS